MDLTSDIGRPQFALGLWVARIQSVLFVRKDSVFIFPEFSVSFPFPSETAKSFPLSFPFFNMPFPFCFRKMPFPFPYFALHFLFLRKRAESFLIIFNSTD